MVVSISRATDMDPKIGTRSPGKWATDKMEPQDVVLFRAKFFFGVARLAPRTH